MGRMRVCVFCGSTPGTDPAFTEAALELGGGLARAGIGLVYGGGASGLMGSVSEGALAAGGEVVGVIPTALVERELARHDVTDLRVVDSMHERKALMYDLADAFVTLPGGFGTFDEFFETITWSKLGLHAKRSLVLDVGGYYEPLRALVAHAATSGFLRSGDPDLVSFHTDVASVLAELTATLSA